MARKLITDSGYDFLTRAWKEGRPWEATYLPGASEFTSPPVRTPGSSTTILQKQVPAGFTFFPTSISYSATNKCSITGYMPVPQSSPHPFSGLDYENIQFRHIFGANGGTINLNPPTFPVYELNTIQTLAIWGETTGSVACSIQGVLVSNDFHMLSDKIIQIRGDSTTWSNIGNDSSGYPLSGDRMYVNRLAKKINEDGKRVRVVNKGFGGANALQTVTAMRQGWYQIQDQIDLIIVSLGMNDCKDGTTTTNFKSYLFEHIYDRNRYNPDATIIFLAPSVTDDATRTPTIQDFRDAVEEVATDAAYGGSANNVYFYDQSTAFSLAATASTDLNFRDAERTSGSRVHPSGLDNQGHDLIYQGLYGVVTTTPFYN